MKTLMCLLAASACLLQPALAEKKPLKVLLIAGGCCHDYENQCVTLAAGIEKRIHAEVTVDLNPSKSTETRFDRYESTEWASGFDVVLHDECSAKVTDKPYVQRILDAHRDGVPAVNLHCAMHSYRWGDFKVPVAKDADNGGWFAMLGLQSSGHGPRSPIDITYTDKKHPITIGLPEWRTIDEELYNNIQVYPSAHVLAKGTQRQKPRGKKPKKGQKAPPPAEAKQVTAVVTWTNHYGPNKTRIFSTTLGHTNETVGDDRYLDLVVRGLLWTTGHLQDDGTPAKRLGR